jgi:3'(2'), 5'-bisphosphate nucleotidase
LDLFKIFFLIFSGYGCHGITRKERQDGKFVLTTTRTHNSPIVDKAIDLLRPDDVIRVGGAGYKVLLVISGNAKKNGGKINFF